jgi:RHS repeat-associated protein
LLIELLNAKNRLIQINYPGTGNESQFAYDGTSKCVQIIETLGGSIASTKDFVWNGDHMQELRNSSGAVVSQYFMGGQTISGVNYYYFRTHRNSVVELADNMGNLQAQYIYDAFGRVRKSVGSSSSDFQFSGYYFHASSGLNLATHRAYSSSLGRWISRDPLNEDGGLNLYAYVSNDPIDLYDPEGLIPIQPYGNWGGPGWSSGINLGPRGELGGFPYLPGQPGFKQPTDGADRCYYHHDVCLHNAGISPDRNKRKCDRRKCDKDLSDCLKNNPAPGVPESEIGLFGGSLSPNNNPGPDPDPNDPQQPYKVIDPGIAPSSAQ